MNQGTIQNGTLLSSGTYELTGGEISANLGGSAGLVVNAYGGNLKGSNTFGGNTVVNSVLTLASTKALYGVISPSGPVQKSRSVQMPISQFRAFLPRRHQSFTVGFLIPPVEVV